MRRHVIATGLGALALAGAAGATTPAEDRGGPSTPDVVVTAQDPSISGDGPRITLVARTDAEAVPSASLVLRFAGMSMVGLDAHRVAVGDTGCGGHEDLAPAVEEVDGDRAVVRGLAVLREGGGALPDGSVAQVWIDLKDVGSAPYADQARVRIRPAPHGEEAAAEDEDGSCGGGQGGWTRDSGWRPVQQVRIHWTASGG